MAFFSDIALPASFFGVMLLLGLSLQASDFKAIWAAPKALILGLVSQMVLLPALAFVLVSVYPMSGEMAIGFILLSACPGGSTSNLASYMARGNVALSVSLTVLNSFLVIFSLPVVMHLAQGFLDFGDTPIILPFWKTVGEISLLTIVPVLLGLLFRSYFPLAGKRLESVFKYLMPGLMAASIVGGALFGQKSGSGASFDNYLLALAPALILNVVSMSSGYVLAFLFRLPNRDRFTISIEVGIQNAALAITIALGSMFLHNEAIGVPAMMYLLFPFFTALAFSMIANRKELRGALFNRPRPPQP